MNTARARGDREDRPAERVTSRTVPPDQKAFTKRCKTFRTLSCHRGNKGPQTPSAQAAMSRSGSTTLPTAKREVIEQASRMCSCLSSPGGQQMVKSFQAGPIQTTMPQEDLKREKT